MSMEEAIRLVERGLAQMVELSAGGQVTCAELRRGLDASKGMRCRLDAYQANAASLLAKRESHGDGGTGVLAQAAGLSRRAAAGQVKTAERLQALPDVQRAVESGQVSFTNARALADAADKTSAEAVTEDSALLAKAQSLTPEQFAREAGRWAAQRQDDGGEAGFRRLRRRRRLSIWDGDDGMMHLRGEFDPVAGAKLRNRLCTEAERLRRGDLKLPERERRSRHQRMADAFESLTAGGGVGGSKPSADIAIVQHLSADGTKAFAEIEGGGTIPQSVLDEHFCNARITGIVFSDEGVPLWHGHSKRRATDAQKRALLAIYGGCAGCQDAHPMAIQAHHVDPASQGGPTDVSNLIPLCWLCHQRVHQHGWRVVPDGRGLRTIEPPDRVRYGPAHAPESVPMRGRERSDVSMSNDTAQHEPATARAGLSGPAAARNALREVTGNKTGPSPPQVRTRPGSHRRAARVNCSTGGESRPPWRVGRFGTYDSVARGSRRVTT
ncbi:MAG: DUF222 domain-containing protein [Acidimicrobiaceae bacterium]|nr:DUF222 domain-containing protein [Acidimicrobiaceae bacterium]MYE75992.1 DUF222 domain-containing protein [Acidimicrobiaceae bacterium]MYJ42713.1 DUF222 domain-containing protein [Acidimicrobiaceae bacterium]